MFSLVKRERLWYTMTMKALLSAIKQLFLGLMILTVVCMPGCAPNDEDVLDQTEETELAEEDAPSGVMFTLLSANGEVCSEQFFAICASEHAVAYVQAHAVSEDAAQELLICFEARIFPQLPAPLSMEKTKLNVLLSYMEGSTYGYMPFPLPDQGPVICLNTLYPDDLAYALAHEYQHLCAYDACTAGETVLSGEMDELLSDMFCELLFPDMGAANGILSEDRASTAREKIGVWGNDALPHVYDLLREGYAEEELLSIMENR